MQWVSSSARCVGVQRGVRAYHLNSAQDNAKVRDNFKRIVCRYDLSHTKALQKLEHFLIFPKILSKLCCQNWKIGKINKVSKQLPTSQNINLKNSQEP